MEHYLDKIKSPEETEKIVICKDCGCKTTIAKEGKNEYCPKCKLNHIINFIENPYPSSQFEEPVNQTMLDIIEHEIKELPKLKDFASGSGDSEGYMRLCGQEVILERLLKKLSAIASASKSG